MRHWTLALLPILAAASSCRHEATPAPAPPSANWVHDAPVQPDGPKTTRVAIAPPDTGDGGKAYTRVDYLKKIPTDRLPPALVAAASAPKTLASTLGKVRIRSVDTPADDAARRVDLVKAAAMPRKLEATPREPPPSR